MDLNFFHTKSRYTGIVPVVIRKAARLEVLPLFLWADGLSKDWLIPFHSPVSRLCTATDNIGIIVAKQMWRYSCFRTALTYILLPLGRQNHGRIRQAGGRIRQNGASYRRNAGSGGNGDDRTHGRKCGIPRQRYNSSVRIPGIS